MEDTAVVAPTYLLYDPAAVAVATLLGGPLGGCLMMAANARRLGNRGEAIGLTIAGAILTAGLVLLGYLVDSHPAQILGLLFLVGARKVASSLQGQELEEHVRLGGRLGSRWKAAGVGLAILALIFVVIFGVIWAANNKTELHVGKDQVFYSSGITAEEASAFGEKLKAVGYFQDRGVSAELARDDQGKIMSFVVRDGVWDNAEQVKAFQEVARQVAPAIGGLPVRLRLLDTSSQTKREITVP